MNFITLKNVTLSILLVLGALAGSSPAQQKNARPSDWQIEGLSGRVKNIDEETVTVKLKNGVPTETDRRPTRRMIYDKQGRLTYEWSRIGNLSPFVQDYWYDKEGSRHRRTRRTELFTEGAKQIGTDQLSLMIYRYDAAANILFSEDYRGDKIDQNELHQKYQVKFDATGRVMEKLMFDPAGNQVFKDAYLYGTGNLPTGKDLSMASRPPGQFYRYAYLTDAQGNWTKQTAEMTILKNPNGPVTEITYRKISYYK